MISFLIQAYSALTSGEDVPLTYQVYKLSFLNFLIGKQPNGPGQFIFGPVEAKVNTKGRIRQSLPGGS